MKKRFDAALAEQIKRWIQRLRPGNERQWGKRSPAQVMAHCALGVEMALGEIKPRRKRIGRLIGLAIKPMVLGNDEVFRRNTATVASWSTTASVTWPKKAGGSVRSSTGSFRAGLRPVPATPIPISAHLHPWNGPF